MEISNEGAGQDIFNKLNVRIWRLDLDYHTVEKDAPFHIKFYHNCRRGEDWVVMKRW